MKSIYLIPALVFFFSCSSEEPSQLEQATQTTRDILNAIENLETAMDNSQSLIDSLEAYTPAINMFAIDTLVDTDSTGPFNFNKIDTTKTP